LYAWRVLVACFGVVCLACFGVACFGVLTLMCLACFDDAERLRQAITMPESEHRVFESVEDLKDALGI
jgi:hypothetical protein